MEPNLKPSLPSEEGDPRASLRNLLAPETPQKSLTTPRETPKKELAAKPPPSQESAAKPNRPDANVEGTPQDNAEIEPRYTATTTTTRRNANGSVSSVYSGNRMRYLKKADGEPFWRKDIQFNFLRCVFEDETKVFTKASDGTTGHTFADIYIDAMAKSSKCSQILKEKLGSDRPAAIHMAMICLLVNVGRMNTTLNFFPEMRARVRTYHSIPALQANQGTNAYKQLQDGPRLKSILKGATEDSTQPTTVDAIMQQRKPRTNPVNLTFVLAQYAPRISETHFFPPRDFFDLFMKSTLTSKSRANAFLWLIWWYLESDFTIEDTQNNPFGKGLPGESGGLPNKVPALESLTEEEGDAENEDTEEEVAYGEAKKRERELIVASDMPPSLGGPKRGQKQTLIELDRRYKDSPYTTGSESGGSRRGSLSPSRMEARSSLSPPPIAGGFQAVNSAPRISSLLNDDTPKSQQYEADPRSHGSSSRKGIGRGNWPRSKPQRIEPLPQESIENTYPSVYPNTPGQVVNIAPHYFSPSDDHNRPLEPKARQNSYSEVPVPQGSYHYQPPATSNEPTVFTSGTGSRRRPLTQHQQALERNRRERVNYLLGRRMKSARRTKRRERNRRGVIVDAWIRSKTLPDGWDSDVDDPRGRVGGLDYYVHPLDEIGSDDLGQTADSLAKAWRSVGRALDGFKAVKPVRKRLREDAAYDPYPDVRDSSYPATNATADQPARRGSGAGQQTAHFLPPTTTVSAKEADGLKGKRPYKRRKPRADAAGSGAEDGVKIDGRKKRRSLKGPGARGKLGLGGEAGALAAAAAADDGEDASSRVDDAADYESVMDADNDGDLDGDDETVVDESMMDVDRPEVEDESSVYRSSALPTQIGVRETDSAGDHARQAVPRAAVDVTMGDT